MSVVRLAIAAISLALVLFRAEASVPRYRVIDLGSTNLEIADINDSGTMCGTMNQHAVLVSPTGAVTDLGAFGRDQSEAKALNNDGWVVGSSWNNASGSMVMGYYRDSSGNVIQSGQGRLYDVNNSGTIVGSAWNPATNAGEICAIMNGVTYFAGPDAERWIGGIGCAVSDDGLVVGRRSHGTIDTVILWNPVTGSMVSYEVPQGYGEGICGFTESGELLVTRRNVATGTSSLLLKSMTNVRSFDIGRPGDTVRDVNKSGQIVGYRSVFEGSVVAPYIYDPAVGVVNVSTLIDTPGWSVYAADEINNNGWIVGTASNGTSYRRVLLMPVPEPSSLAAIAFALGALGVFRRRR